MINFYEKIIFLAIFYVFTCVTEKNAVNATSITPHYLSDEECDNPPSVVSISPESKFEVESSSGKVTCYLSKQNVKELYPIAIVCTGSSSREHAISAIHIHRHFLGYFLERGIAVLTIDQFGIDHKSLDIESFMQHYTRSNRLHDHTRVIDELKRNPPPSWNGKFIFLGVSEGGPLVTSLTTLYSEDTLATLNFSGAPGFSWREELWLFITNMKQNLPWYIKPLMRIKPLICILNRTPLIRYFPHFITRETYDGIMNNSLRNPTTEKSKEFMGMTPMYHQDSLTYPPPDYLKIKTPFLVVAGMKDGIFPSCEKFVTEGQKNGAPVDSMFIPDMGHIVRNRLDVIEGAFKWFDKKNPQRKF